MVKGITIHDIARMANVSTATVSYVVNHRPGVSEERRRLVESIIEETGYTPSSVSRKLRLNCSYNIHVVMAGQTAFDDMFYNAALERMMTLCNENGYNLVLSDAKHYQRSVLRQAIVQKDVDGVIFLQEAAPEAMKCLTRRGIPCVVLDAHRLSEPYHCVYCDYGESVAAATAHLLAHGHRRIGFLGTEEIPEFFNNAYGGYRRAMVQHGVTPPAAWAYRCRHDRAVPAAVVQAVIDAPISAVICATDRLAVTLMQQLAAQGVRVPQDISVCGMDDVLIARYATPALTTVEIDKQAMGEEAVRLLLRLINGEETEGAERICVHCTKVVHRDSVALL